MEARCRKIRLLLLDVDGVLTDGRIIYDNNGVESKAFDVKDGHGLKLVQRAGIKVGIITGRQSQVVAHRAAELGIEILRQGAKDKLPPYQEILAQLGLRDEEVAYVGDDVVDLPVLRRVGLAVTVRDAVDDLKPLVHYVTQRPGGRGAVREVCDLILKKSQRWESVAGRYFSSEEG
ncbi:3-deoxy-D-manno-octulosonate 8-phosphate phosphatase (KDO 8-P phosphatase) [Geoalkalibacter ferrihydriticus]|uniref:3-deoxy-D-manno-octulosonate 8-phosphate phosphatase KdsC n=2 Tax=Geoalkalibacter ferrihydriticus TaxID=392333 RepID=A0A0C2DSY6_9BACT|nr:HAD-IIIA family hydrolase [Geoalkalibacter ferrihydriticus]KIH76569.1 3-deoxy-D-manno-octulosonate 8-phosphate phosphatase [Geoalkalibacter ferrihydriticus DSM 17813]SDM01869.1 3-deoxy-D-manno-octulosonate 8-phosphate phosphatase (KDO 8-P phosphatase) [Geoalkalibacter ferrihydriticus]